MANIKNKKHRISYDPILRSCELISDLMVVPARHLKKASISNFARTAPTIGIATIATVSFVRAAIAAKLPSRRKLPIDGSRSIFIPKSAINGHTVMDNASLLTAPAMKVREGMNRTSNATNIAVVRVSIEALTR